MVMQMHSFESMPFSFSGGGGKELALGIINHAHKSVNTPTYGVLKCLERFLKMKKIMFVYVNNPNHNFLSSHVQTKSLLVMSDICWSRWRK